MPYILFIIFIIINFNINALEISQEINHTISPKGPLTNSEIETIKRNLRSKSPNNFASALGKPTYTYVRCYYHSGNSKLDVNSNYKWAINPDGSYYKLYGNWFADGIFNWKNMFYTNIKLLKIKEICDNTINKKVGEGKTSLYQVAADNVLSYNQTIWQNSSFNNKNKFDRVIAFGDSLSDNNNMYNLSYWKLPNKNSWFQGRFSNGFTWPEYLSNNIKVQHYNWAIGGAASNTAKFIVPGLMQEVQSWSYYIQNDLNYRPENTLFTILIGGNDFINYDKDVNATLNELKMALDTLIDAGAKYIVILNLPDITTAPFLKSDPNKAIIIKNKVAEYNKELKDLVDIEENNQVNIMLFDTYEFLEKIKSSPQEYGIVNTTDSCLNIDNSKIPYLNTQQINHNCTNPDEYLFWDNLHITTHMHKILADEVFEEIKKHEIFRKKIR
jgi:thermolabile hemolysin